MGWFIVFVDGFFDAGTSLAMEVRITFLEIYASAITGNN
jgi:predicted ATPase